MLLRYLTPFIEHRFCNPGRMSTIKSLKITTSRRQLLLTGLAALTLTGMSKALAREQSSALNTTTTHSKPKAKKPGAKRVVMLDPGHGGIDTGAIGHNGSKEKHVVLAIAKNVRALLRNHGIEAKLTRTGDHFIPLYDRVEIAHQHGADLFMSIHADGFTNPSAAGASVFALSNRGASSAMAKYLSERENAADELAGKAAKDKDHLLQQVLFDLVQTDTIKNSLTLGSHILRQIKPVHRLHSKATEQAAFVVLKSPSIPSVLVETSFITNPDEERLLGTPAFRQKIARAIADGVVSYFNWFDNQKAHAKRS
uniref:N-acetylmuramoyl-L-alanine amidase AmiA n=2 Tax=Siccibacter turicensis TaxID=357233 RepID=C7C555_9ENTR|nr:Probable N-acetylmuramoyl-L-alanine amidase amiA [Siccibacter turicensis LMG 23730]